jgi:hypothetical protein
MGSEPNPNPPDPKDATQRPVLIVYDREPKPHLKVVVGYAFGLGEEIPVIRGDGPRESERMGTATVIGFEADGTPSLDIQIGEEEE